MTADHRVTHMNILTVNLLFSALVFWIATRLYVLPRLDDCEPRAVLLPILLLHSLRHLGVRSLDPAPVTSMACCGTLANRPQLPCNNLRLPFRIKGHRQDRSALITKKLEYRNCSFRDLVTGSKCFNDDIGYCIALWTLGLHACLRGWH